MVTYDQFDVILVLFPFSERKGTKQRPSVVLSNSRFNFEHGHCIVAMVTTANVTRWPSDLVISETAKAGLHAPSVVRAKLFTVSNDLVIGKVGQLARVDAEALVNWLSDLMPFGDPTK